MDKLATNNFTREELKNMEPKSIQMYDWIEGIGTVNDFAIIGFLNQLSRADIKLVYQPKGE